MRGNGKRGIVGEKTGGRKLTSSWSLWFFSLIFSVRALVLPPPPALFWKSLLVEF